MGEPWESLSLLNSHSLKSPLSYGFPSTFSISSVPCGAGPLPPCLMSGCIGPSAPGVAVGRRAFFPGALIKRVQHQSQVPSGSGLRDFSALSHWPSGPPKGSRALEACRRGRNTLGAWLWLGCQTRASGSLFSVLLHSPQLLLFSAGGVRLSAPPSPSIPCPERWPVPAWGEPRPEGGKFAVCVPWLVPPNKANVFKKRLFPGATSPLETAPSLSLKV